jgi:hypothetical protein
MATTKTELYNNGTLVATKTSAPFNTFDWTPASGEVGSASLTVKRYEDGVLVATSAAVGGTVDAAAGAYDADYQAILDYGTAQGYTLPSSAEQDAGNQYMLDLKSTGLYARSKVLFIPNKGGDNNFKLICWKRKTVMTNVAGTFDAAGYQGASGCAIKTGFIPSTDTSLRNNAGFGVVQLIENAPSAYIMGTRSASNTGNMISIVGDTSQRPTFRFNDSATATSATTYLKHINKLLSFNKKNATTYEIISGSTADANRVNEELTVTDGGAATPNSELYFMAWHRQDDGEGTISNSNTTGKVKFMYYGESIEDIHDAVNAIVK